MATNTMNDLTDAVKRIGTVGMLECDGLTVPVRIVNAKEAYGCVRFWVEPVGGKGRQWVDAGRVRASPAQADATGLPNLSEALDALASLAGAFQGTTAVLADSMPCCAAVGVGALDAANALLFRARSVLGGEGGGQ